MAGFLTSGWINVVAAIAGGIMLGFGIGRFAHEPSPVPAIAAVLGLIVLWWSIADRRKYTPGNPESETDGSHTVE